MQAQKLSNILPKVSPRKGVAPLSADLTELEIAALFLDTTLHSMQEIRVEMRKLRTTELTVPQFRALANLWCEPANNRMLAETLGLSVAATSRMVDWLIKHGLAEKAQHETDRRQIIVQLTPLGKRSFELNQKQTRLRFEKRIQSLSAPAKKNLALGLIALKKALAEMASE
jgi:DNA-binding MarR family transcriptional regulator